MDAPIEWDESWSIDVPDALAAWLDRIERDLSADVPGYDVVFNRARLESFE